MALITSGSLNDFSVRASEKIIRASEKRYNPHLKKITSLSELKEAAKDIPKDAFEFIKSAEPRGVAIKSLQLNQGFEGFLQNVFNPTNELYIVAYAWDMSNTPVNLYPGKNAEASQVIIPVKVGNVREFIGEGINLFPKRDVLGGIALRIHLWESDEKIRNFGKAMTSVADAIQSSKLNNLLSLISLTTGVSGATVSLIKDASIELAKIVGTILGENGDDHVDFFEGYYAADQPWIVGSDPYTGNSSNLTLNKY